MRTKLALGAVTIAATLIGSGGAFAQECPTPEQVKAELADAIRTGDIVVVLGRESGQKVMERFGSSDQTRPAGGGAPDAKKASVRTGSRSPREQESVDYSRLLPFGE